MSPTRRALLQAALAGAVCTLLDPRRAFAPDGSILDGGPWIEDLTWRSEAEGAAIADSWGRRGLRVLLAVRPDGRREREGTVDHWAEALLRMGWQERHRPDPAALPGYRHLRHPDSRRGRITISTHRGDLISGTEAVLLDTRLREDIESLVRLALFPWAGWMWFGTRYQRFSAPLSRARFEALRTRVAHLLPPRPPPAPRPAPVVRVGPLRGAVLADPATLALQGLARLERAGVVPPRLTDPRDRLWRDPACDLGPAAFVERLFADAARTHPVPFALSGLPEGVFPATAVLMIDEATRPLDVPTTEFLCRSARRLGRPGDNTLTALPRVLPRARVLELAGTSGRGAAWLVGQHPDLDLEATFSFHSDCIEDDLLIGLACMERGARRPELLSTAALRAAVRAGRRFDHVICHRGFDPSARLARELFAPAQIMWV